MALVSISPTERGPRQTPTLSSIADEHVTDLPEDPVTVTSSRRAPPRKPSTHSAESRLEGEAAAGYTSDATLAIDVDCRVRVGRLNQPVRFALAASLEVAAELEAEVDVHAEVQARLQEEARAAAQARARAR